MDFITKLAMSILLIKKADQVLKDKPFNPKIKTWDEIKGIPGGNPNKDYTNALIPNPENQPIDLGYNNKQIVSGTGHGALIYGKYRNN